LGASRLLLRRFGGARVARLCSACSTQQFGVPQAPTSYCERALPHQFVRDVGRTASVRIATLFMLRGDRKDMATVNNFARNTTDIT
jgi:hypothetical protein